jgi:MFS family permease
MCPCVCVRECVGVLVPVSALYLCVCVCACRGRVCACVGRVCACACVVTQGVGGVAAQGALANNNVALVGLYFALVGIGSSGAYIAALAPNVRNFSPNHRGLVVGLLVAMCGLSALLFSQIYQAFFVREVPGSGSSGNATESDTFCLLQFMAITLGVVSTVGGLTMRTVRPETGATPAVGSPTAAAAAAMKKKDDDSSMMHHNDDQTPLLINTDMRAPTPMPTGSEAATSPSAAMLADAGTPVRRTRYSAVRVFKTRDFWLMFVALFCASGAGLMYINRYACVCSCRHVCVCQCLGLRVNALCIGICMRLCVYACASLSLSLPFCSRLCVCV